MRSCSRAFSCGRRGARGATTLATKPAGKPVRGREQAAKSDGGQRANKASSRRRRRFAAAARPAHLLHGLHGRLGGAQLVLLLLDDGGAAQTRLHLLAQLGHVGVPLAQL